MKKVMLLLMTFLLVAFLAACGDESDASANDTEESSEETSDDAAEEETEENEGQVYEYNQEIADNDNFKATLVSIEQSYDEFFESDVIEVTFEVENKRDDAVEFQARQVSIDGKMVDEMLLSMSQEVAGGKSADAVLTIEDYEGGEIPALEGDFEMLLNVFSWDDMDYDEEAEVNVTFE